jgi:hypothetical protein
MVHRLIVYLFSTLLATAFLASTADAQTLQFEGFPTGALSEGVVNTEAEFELENLSGSAWGIDSGGNPNQAFWVGWQAPIVIGDQFSIRRADGEPFVFVSVDHRSGGGTGQSDGVDLVGLVDGSEVASIDGFSITGTVWGTQQPGFGLIDELRIVGVSVGDAALVFDNFVFGSGGDALFEDRFEAP